MKGIEKKHIFDRLIEISLGVAIAIIIFLAIGINARVGIRYTLGFPINWVIDFSTIFQIYLTFLAAAWLLKEEGHVSIDIILTFLKPHHRYFIQVINSILCTVICMILTIYGAIETWSSWKSKLYLGMPLEPPKWISLIVIPLGTLFLMIQFIRRTFGFLEKYKNFYKEKQ